MNNKESDSIKIPDELEKVINETVEKVFKMTKSQKELMLMMFSVVFRNGVNEGLKVANNILKEHGK